MLAKGDTFWLSGTGGAANPAGSHLHCALTNPCAARRQLIVNMASQRPPQWHDPSCELLVGDHPVIVHPSYIIYARAVIISEAQFTAWGAKCRLVAPFPAAVFTRICAGLVLSRSATPAIKNYLIANAGA
jgi:hypothetical protein